ncbi:signal peptidase I [Curtobacterium sp. MCLR17_036]|uniref:signal peptidase I n=1 Tax=Curtobacterium sp. MCLR17_036 TaxID=2175620 RepID=UPI000DA8A1D1|nr:signal peptidase I [Curtobacterium sp. MCLR17_036]WIE65082.1 signal peptidase I [Curtobacterium sp. MCLR17_036]
MRSSSWIRFAAVLTARGVIAALLGLLFWAVAPMLLGWHSTTVMTGSMEPSLHVGDVVVSKTVTPHELRKGQVLLFADPDHVGTLRMHRFDTLNDDGTLTTKGDANPAADSTPVTRSAVLGVGYLRVPLIGTPVRWAADGDAGALVALGAALLALAALAVTPAVADGRTPTGPTAGRARHRAAPRRPRTTVAVAFAIAAAVGALALPAPAAAASFAASTAAPTGSLTAATATPVSALTCTSNPDGSVTIGWAYAGAAPERFTTLVDGQATATAAPATRSTTLSSRDLFTWRTSTVSVRTDLTPAWTATSDSTVRIVTVKFLGFGRSSCG